MGEVGILGEDDRVELLEGEIVEMTPIGSVHASVVSRLTALLVPAAAGRAIVRVQDPAILSDFSAPQPDIAIVDYREDFYGTAHPRPDDVLLLIEVADSSIRTDLGWKARIYAAAGVREYWVIDLSRRRIVTHAAPDGERYTTVARRTGADTVATAAFAGASWTVDEILGPPVST